VEHLAKLSATSCVKREGGTGDRYLYRFYYESLGKGSRERFEELFGLFSKAIRDLGSVGVRVNTLLALDQIAIYLDAEESKAPIKAYQDLFTAMIAILKDTIDQGNKQAFEVFQAFLGCHPTSRISLRS
jgi:importin-4